MTSSLCLADPLGSTPLSEKEKPQSYLQEMSQRFMGVVRQQRLCQYELNEGETLFADWEPDPELCLLGG